MQSKTSQLTSPPAGEELALPSLRLAPLFQQQATDQSTPPSPLRQHLPEPAPVAARRTPPWPAGRPLPRLTVHGTAVDPALHELRVASLDRGLLWHEATPSPSAPAARSAPTTMVRPAAAALAARAASSDQTAGTGERVMQGLRVKAELQRRQIGPATDAAQLAGKLAIAASVASASQLSSPKHVNTAVTVAVAAATFAASATVAAAFSVTPSHSIGTAGTCKGGDSAADHNTGDNLTFSPLCRGIMQSPMRCSEYMNQAGVLFSAMRPAKQPASEAAGVQSVSPWPNAGMSPSQPETAVSLSDQPSEEDRDASPATSIISDKENLSPPKPDIPFAAVGAAPTTLRLGLSNRSVPGAAGRAALASQPTLPPRSARRGPQAALPTWQVIATFPWDRCRPRADAWP